MRQKLGFIIMDRFRNDYLYSFAKKGFGTSRAFVESPVQALRFESRKAAHRAILESGANALVMALYEGDNHYYVAY